MRRALLSSVAALLVAAPSLAGSVGPSGPSSSGAYEISLLTMAPGEHLFSRFGHNALVVRDPKTGHSEVFNFGTLNASDPNLLSKYLDRTLRYYLSVDTLPNTIAFYRGRTVWAQRLSLPPAAAEKLVAKVRWQARPENREYIYDHFIDNCSTRIRDLVDEVTGGALRRALGDAPTGSTLRSEVESLTGLVPHERFALNYLLSGEADRPTTRWQLLFLPRHLRDALREIRIRGEGGEERALLAGEYKLVEGRLEPTEVVSWPLHLLAGAFLGPLALAGLAGPRRRAARIAAGVLLAVWGLAAAVGSAVLFYLWSTNLPATQANGTLWLNTPLHLCLVPLGILLAIGRLGPRTGNLLRKLLWLFVFAALGWLVAYATELGEKAQTGYALFSLGMALFGRMACRRAEVRALQPVLAPATDQTAS